MNKMSPGYPYLLLNHQIKIESEQIEIKAGSRSCMVNVLWDDERSSLGDNFVYLPPAAARKLKIPSTRYRSYFISPHTIYLGPIVGVISTTVGHDKTYPLGKKATIFREIVNAGWQAGVFIYFFFPGAVDRQHALVKGYTLDAGGRWYWGTFPLPDIVYNRILYRNIEIDTDVKRELDYLRNHRNIYFFNTRYLDKWEMYQALSKHNDTAQLVPETYKFDRDKFKRLLSRYPEVFLKPRRGSRGKGIIKIQRTGKNKYFFAHAHPAQCLWKPSSNLNNLYTRLAIYRNDGYLLQKGIDLAKYHGRVFDLRTQMQKDRTGRWIISGAAVRVAAHSRFLTHIPNGGKAESLEHVIKAVFANTEEVIKSINAQLGDICSLVPAILEQELALNLAILSMDIGIDSNGKLWIIEANSKPASFDEKGIRAKHNQHLVDYFIFSAINNIERI